MRSRWMNLSIALATVLMLALPVLAVAQTSRVEGMALQGDYIKDYTGIYTYPSAITGVGNLMYGEFGTATTFSTTTTDKAVGGVMDKLFDGRFGVWGLHLRQVTPEFGQGDNSSQPAPGVWGSDQNTNNNEAFDLMWGRKSGTTSLGLRLNRSYYKNKLEAAGVTTNLAFDPAAPPGNLGRNIMGYGAGVGFEMNAQTAVEIAGQLQTRTFENSTNPIGAGTNLEDNGATSYQIAIRAMRQWKPNVMIVPVFKITSYDLSEKATTGAGTTSFDNSMRGWQIGISSDWTLGTNDLMVWGLTFAQNKIDEDQNLFGLPDAGATASTVTETLMPQLFMALETHVNNWLTLRFGANKGAFESLKIENKTTGANATRTFTSSSFNMNMGAGVKVGTLQFDALMAQNFFQNVGWVGSGVPQTYFPKVTATYSF